MLREEQIDIRRQRARASKFVITRIGKNRVFSDYEVVNPASGGQYTVAIRGFETGDNSCSCPDFRTNTLGTCKHIEAVLEFLAPDAPAHIRQRKAAPTRPEIALHYGEQVSVMLNLPARYSDALGSLAKRFFNDSRIWIGGDNYDELIRAIEDVPEQVTIFSDAMEFIDRQTERRDLTQLERVWLADLDRGSTPEPLRDLLRVPLYDYQLRGAVFLACRMRAILGDDMGLGKSAQALAAAELLARQRGLRKVLIVAPASVKYQWETEIRKFTTRTVQVIEGLQEGRREQYGDDTFYKLVNYEQVLRDVDLLNNWQPDLVIIDEAQRIKNWESKTSRAVKRLRSRYAIALTGTPLENKLEELYSIVQFVDDRLLGPAFQFLSEHRVTDEAGTVIAYRNLEVIREKLKPILLRRTRAEVLTQLPPRVDKTVFVELADAQRIHYDDQRSGLGRLLAKNYLTDLDRKRILAHLSNMRLICDSTYLFDKSTHVSPKLDEFGELIVELVTAGGHKAVVFSQWETMLQQAAEVLRRLNVGYVILHGSVAAKDRKSLLDRFRNEDSCRVFLSTDAGGTGLNLQAADTVINLEMPWNPAILEQRIARAHRMGQERSVRVINFVTRGTIEERVLRCLEQKRALFAGVFDGESDEINFEAAGQASFLDGIRQLLQDEESPRGSAFPVSSPLAVEVPSTNMPPDLATATLTMLEALAALARAGSLWSASPEIRYRAKAALLQLSESLANE